MAAPDLAAPREGCIRPGASADCHAAQHHAMQAATASTVQALFAGEASAYLGNGPEAEAVFDTEGTLRVGPSAERRLGKGWDAR